MIAPPIETIRAGSDIVTSRLRIMHRNARGTAAPPSRKPQAAADHCERATVIAGCILGQVTCGQDQLVLRRQPQAVVVLAMRDDDLALRREQLAAVDPVAAHDDGTRVGAGLPHASVRLRAFS